MFNLTFKTAAVLFLLITIQLYSQPSGEEFRRTAVIDGNDIKTVITNYGVIGQPDFVGPRATWNGINNVYFGDMSILLGLELPIKDYRIGPDPPDGIPDTIVSVIITPVNRPGGGDSGYGQAWGFEPLDSSYNPDITDPTKGISLSNYSETWPEIWPDHPEYGTGVWNGLYGPDIYVGTQEAYFKIDDEEDEEMFIRHDFLPDSINPNVKGHGISVGIRYVQLDNPLFKDILFRIFDIKNESLHDYHKLVFGGLTGTYVGGGTPEWNDDVALYYPLDNIIVSYDFDEYIEPAANPNWEGDVGKFGEAFIHAPSNNLIASFQYFVPAGDITMSDEVNMWWRLHPGYYDYPSSIIWQDSIPIAVRGEDGDYIWGTKYFTLNAGETKRIATVLAFGYTNGDVLEKIRLAEALYHSNFDTSAIHQVVTLTSHTDHKTVNGIETIEWQSQNSGGTVEILYSSDGGNNWERIVKNAPNIESYLWNTEEFEDGLFCLLKIYIKNEDGFIYGLTQSNYFTVNNSGNGKPYIEILNSEIGAGRVFDEENYDFNLLVGDPESEPLLINVFYNLSHDTAYYFSQSINALSDTIPQIYNVDFKYIPNSPELRLKLMVTDGTLSSHDETPAFNKQTPRTILSNNNFEILSGYEEVPIEIRVIDTTQFRGHEYIITFEDTIWAEDYKTFSVYNQTRGEYPVLNKPFHPFSESLPFDGMVLYTEDIETQLDTIRSRWNNPHPANLDYLFSPFAFPSAGIYGYKDPFDYILAFSNEYNDSSNYLDQIFGPGAPPTNTNINFKLFRVRGEVTERTHFAFTEATSFRHDTLSHLDQITMANPEQDEVSWIIVTIDPDSSANIPAGGDTLYIYTMKGLSRYDTLRLFDLPADVKNTQGIPLRYSLSQNYPNPFNPITKIIYQIPEAGKVRLIVYDILGREVAAIVNEYRTSGTYEVNFNASALASGVYLYRLNVNNYVNVKKMLLLK
jgi:hypothetical protein